MAPQPRYDTSPLICSTSARLYKNNSCTAPYKRIWTRAHPQWATLTTSRRLVPIRKRRVKKGRNSRRRTESRSWNNCLTAVKLPRRVAQPPPLRESLRRVAGHVWWNVDEHTMLQTQTPSREKKKIIWVKILFFFPLNVIIRWFILKKNHSFQFFCLCALWWTSYLSRM